MIKWPNLLLVAGTSRNVGKTTLICKLIEKTVEQNYIVNAIKITPHNHKLASSLKVIHKTNNFTICEELADDIQKDSSRMLAAGAKKVFYIQCTDSFLHEAFETIQPLLKETDAVVCESAALYKIIEPGIFIVMSGKQNDNEIKNNELIDKCHLHIVDYKYHESVFDFSKERWILRGI